jgi:hypothetical protein
VVPGEGIYFKENRTTATTGAYRNISIQAKDLFRSTDRVSYSESDMGGYGSGKAAIEEEMNDFIRRYFIANR